MVRSPLDFQTMDGPLTTFPRSGIRKDEGRVKLKAPRASSLGLSVAESPQIWACELGE